MKQFQCTFPNGTKSLAYTPAEVCQQFPLSVAAVSDLNIGETAVDRDGDIWVRLPDLGEAPIVVTDQAWRDERLERIATAVLTGLAAIPNNSLHLTVEDVVRIDVERTVVYAKALIAELDKQA